MVGLSTKAFELEGAAQLFKADFTLICWKRAYTVGICDVDPLDFYLPETWSGESLKTIIDSY